MPRARRSFLAALSPLVLGALLLLPAGCGSVPERTGDPGTDLRSSDPHVKVLAAQEAARRRDPTTVPLLIELLADDETWVRYNAHMALNVIVGPKPEFGYIYTAPPRQRADAIRRYRDWYEAAKNAPPEAPAEGAPAPATGSGGG